MQLLLQSSGRADNAERRHLRHLRGRRDGGRGWLLRILLHDGAVTARRTGTLRVPEGREAADLRAQRHGCERREGVAPGEDNVQRRQFFISGLASKSPEEVYEGTYSGTTASIPSFQIVKDADGERRVTKEIVK